MKKLTALESNWLRELQAVLEKCPSTRLAAYTVGDSELVVYDKQAFDAYRKSNPDDNRDDVVLHGELGTVLKRVAMPFLVDGVCG